MFFSMKCDGQTHFLGGEISPNSSHLSFFSYHALIILVFSLLKSGQCCCFLWLGRKIKAWIMISEDCSDLDQMNSTLTLVGNGKPNLLRNNGGTTSMMSERYFVQGVEREEWMGEWGRGLLCNWNGMELTFIGFMILTCPHLFVWPVLTTGVSSRWREHVKITGGTASRENKLSLCSLVVIINTFSPIWVCLYYVPAWSPLIQFRKTE